MRALNEQGSTPLDGLHTQRDEVYMKVSTTVDHCWKDSGGKLHWKIVPHGMFGRKDSPDVSNDHVSR